MKHLSNNFFLLLALTLFTSLQGMIKDYEKPESIKTADVKSLIRNHADLDKPDSRKRTVLMQCAANGKHRAVQALIAAQANLDNKDQEGLLAFNHAELAYTRSSSEKEQALYMSIMLDLINSGSPCNSNDQICLLTLFFQAAQEGKLPAVKRLLEQNVPVNGVDATGNNALHYAVRKLSMGKKCSSKLLADKREVIMELSARGINVNHANTIQETPLIAAVEEANPDAVNALLKNEAIDINAKGDCGFTATHLALADGSGEIAEMLINDPRFNPTIRNDLLMTPLHVAAFSSDEKIVEMLLKLKDSDPDAQDVDENTPLHLAILAGSSLIDKLLNAREREPIVKLLKKQTSLDITNKKGLTAPQLAKKKASFLDSLIHPDRKKIWERLSEKEDSRERRRTRSYRQSQALSSEQSQNRKRGPSLLVL